MALFRDTESYAIWQELSALLCKFVYSVQLSQDSSLFKMDFQTIKKVQILSIGNKTPRRNTHWTPYVDLGLLKTNLHKCIMWSFIKQQWRTATISFWNNWQEGWVWQLYRDSPSRAVGKKSRHYTSPWMFKVHVNFLPLLFNLGMLHSPTLICVPSL